MISNEFYDKLQKARSAIYYMNSLQTKFYEQNNLLEKVKVKYNQKKRCTLGSASWIFIFLFSLFGFLPTGYLFIVFLKNKVTFTDSLLFFFIDFIFSLSGLFLITYVFIKVIKLIFFRLRTKRICSKQADVLIVNMNNIYSEIENFNNTGFKTALFIPPNYRYPLAVDYIIECIVNGRAENMKEAVNLYEQQVHNWKVENYLKELEDMQWQQYIATQNMEYELKNIGFSTAVSAIHSFKR